MDFSYLMQLADKNKESAAKDVQVKRYSTEVSKAKKIDKSTIDAVSIKAFLQKKDEAEREKNEKAKKEKAKLLALRAANPKSNKAAKLMKSRTKDNDFSIIKLSEDEQILKKKVNLEMQRKETLGKLQRMKLRIELENQGRTTLAHRKRKHKPKDGKQEEVLEDIKLFDHEKGSSFNSSSEPVHRPRKQKHLGTLDTQTYAVGTHLKKHEKRKIAGSGGAPPKMDFTSLLALANKLQHKPVEAKVEKPVEERPMTKKEKRESSYHSSSSSQSGAKHKESVNSLKLNKIPKKNASQDNDRPASRQPSGKTPNHSVSNSAKNGEILSNYLQKGKTSSLSKENRRSENKPQVSRESKSISSVKHSQSKSASCPERKMAAPSSKVPKVQGKTSRDEHRNGRIIQSSKDKKQEKQGSQFHERNRTAGSVNRDKIEQKSKAPSKSESVANYKMAKSSRDVPQYKTSSVKQSQTLPSYSTNKQSKTSVPSKNNSASYSTNKQSKTSVPSKNNSASYSMGHNERKPVSSVPKPSVAKKMNRPPSPGGRFRIVQRNPMGVKRRRIIDSDDEDDEEMADFIDDGPTDDLDYSAHIKEIFGYDKRKYRFEDDDDIQEASFAQQMKEECRSAKIGLMEDLEDIRKEKEEEKKKLMKKKMRR